MGTSGLSERIAARGLGSVTAVDISESAVDAAAARHGDVKNLRFLCAVFNSD